MQAACDPGVAFSIALTLKVMAFAVPLLFLLGVPLGYLLARGAAGWWRRSMCWSPCR